MILSARSTRCQGHGSFDDLDVHQRRQPQCHRCVPCDGRLHSGDASDANGYAGSDTSFCNKVDVTVANTTTGATDKCVYPTQAGMSGVVKHLQPGEFREHDVQRRAAFCARGRRLGDLRGYNAARLGRGHERRSGTDRHRSLHLEHQPVVAPPRTASPRSHHLGDAGP